LKCNKNMYNLARTMYRDLMTDWAPLRPHPCIDSSK
jgi:hypothetical protein